MSDGSCIVAIDVGNSAVKLCVRRGDAANDHDDESLIDHAIEIDGESWRCDVIEWVRHQAGCLSTQWRIASVHRRAVDELEAAIVKDSSAGALNAGASSVGELTSRIQRIHRCDVPMTVDVQQKDRLGIDRLIGAFAAANRFRAPLVVVDAGSAVTVDWVNDKGVFCGGAILPGLRLQALALASGTDALPQIDFMEMASLSVPARETVDAIRLGVITGLAAGIDRLAGDYAEVSTPAGKKRSEEDLKIVLTGGDSSTLSPYLRRPHTVVPNLVCRGLLDLPRSVSSQNDSIRIGNEKLE